MKKETHFGIIAFCKLIKEGRILDGAVICIDGNSYVIRKEVRIIGTDASDGSFKTAISYCMNVQYNERIAVSPENVLKEKPWEMLLEK